LKAETTSKKRVAKSLTRRTNQTSNRVEGAPVAAGQPSGALVVVDVRRRTTTIAVVVRSSSSARVVDADLAAAAARSKDACLM